MEDLNSWFFIDWMSKSMNTVKPDPGYSTRRNIEPSKIKTGEKPTVKNSSEGSRETFGEFFRRIEEGHK